MATLYSFAKLIEIKRLGFRIITIKIKILGRHTKNISPCLKRYKMPFTLISVFINLWEIGTSWNLTNYLHFLFVLILLLNNVGIPSTLKVLQFDRCSFVPYSAAFILSAFKSWVLPFWNKLPAQSPIYHYIVLTYISLKRASLFFVKNRICAIVLTPHCLLGSLIFMFLKKKFILQ